MIFLHVFDHVLVFLDSCIESVELGKVGRHKVRRDVVENALREPSHEPPDAEISNRQIRPAGEVLGVQADEGLQSRQVHHQAPGGGIQQGQALGLCFFRVGEPHRGGDRIGDVGAPVDDFVAASLSEVVAVEWVEAGIGRNRELVVLAVFEDAAQFTDVGRHGLGLREDLSVGEFHDGKGSERCLGFDGLQLFPVGDVVEGDPLQEQSRS
mmetsp:Transcript_23533/g.65317  ORF Transcript_23533/g.65317 Transcript_23533/m.65317 type:complete len:210 (+) Transcript_23533:2186-2815(+)